MDLATLRDTYKTRRREIERRQRQELASELAPLQSLIEDEVVQMYVSGESISAICRAYGTSARITIYDILKEHGVYER